MTNARLEEATHLRVDDLVDDLPPLAVRRHKLGVTQNAQLLGYERHGQSGRSREPADGHRSVHEQDEEPEAVDVSRGDEDTRNDADARRS